MRPVVLVTDGEQRAALAVVRSLGRAGWRAIVCSPVSRSLAGASRYAAEDITLPSPLDEPGAFANAIVDLAAQERADLILPISELALLAILPERHRLAPARIPFPDADAFLRISDKALLLRHAAPLGIAVPAQVELATRDLLSSIESSLPFPLVLKPSRSVGESGGRREKTGVRHAANATELRQQVSSMSDAAFPLLLQQRVLGPGAGIFLLVWNGRIIAQFAHRRLREKPPAGGVSVYRESIIADPELVRRSAALLKQFDWYGPAMIEYKIDQETGTPYLMEINPRFWGSLQLAIDAGVDFPLLLASAAVDERPEPVLDYQVGIRSRWWWGDFDHLIARLRKSRTELALPIDSPGRGRTLLDFLRLWRGEDRNEILHLDDPWPAVRETIAWFSEAWNSRR